MIIDTKIDMIHNDKLLRGKEIVIQRQNMFGGRGFMSDEILEIEMSIDELEELIMNLPRILKDLELRTVENIAKEKNMKITPGK